MTAPTPPAARRLARFENARTHASFLTVPAAFGVRATGLEAVGDVMGCIAFQTAYEYLGTCGATSSTPHVTYPSTTSSYVQQLSAAYRTALERLRAEAHALGADGVLGITLQLEHYDELREIVAIGTAVRSTGRLRPGRIFTTDLSGVDVAKLLTGGWVPVELHVAVQLGLRHNDSETMAEANPVRANGNREVSGYTELRQQLTLRVRDQLRTRVARGGADGALLSALRFEPCHRPCPSRSGRSDLVGLATATGTSIARFAAPAKAGAPPLTVLPIGRTPSQKTSSQKTPAERTRA